MNTKKFLIGTVVGGIVVFFVGYLLYGVLLMSFFNQHSIAPPGSMKSMNDFSWGALVLANFATGALLTYIILKIGNVNSFGSGAGLGFVIGLFMYLGDYLLHYATGNYMDLTGTLADVITGAVLTAIAGGIIAAVLNMGKKKV
jgi:hypothetical protein